MISENIKLPSNRKFGLFFSIIFLILGTYFSYEKNIVIAFSFFFLAIIFFSITIINQDLLHPLNKLWMKFGIFLGKFFSPIILGVLFFGLFTPISLLMKLFQRDELRLKINNRKTHWKMREKNNNEKNSFKHQF